MQKLWPFLRQLLRGFLICLSIAAIFSTLSYGTMGAGGEALLIAGPFIPFFGLLFVLPAFASLGYLGWVFVKGRIAEGLGGILAIVCVAIVSQSLHLTQVTAAQAAAARIGPSALVSRSEVLEIGNDVCGDGCVTALAFHGFQVSSLTKNPYEQLEVPKEAVFYTKIPIGECFKTEEGTSYYDFMSLGYFDFCIARKQTTATTQTVRIWSVNNPQHPRDNISYSVSIEATRLHPGSGEQIARWTKAYVAPVTYFPFSLAPTEQGKMEGWFQNDEFIKALTGIDTASNIARSPDFQPLQQIQTGLKFMLSEDDVLRRNGSSIVDSARVERDAAAARFLESEVQRLWDSGGKRERAAAAELCYKLSPAVIKKLAPMVVNYALHSQNYDDLLWAHTSWCARRAVFGLGYEGAPQDRKLALQLLASSTAFNERESSVLEVAYLAAASNPDIGKSSAVDALLDYHARVAMSGGVFAAFHEFCNNPDGPIVKLCPVLTAEQAIRLIDQEASRHQVPSYLFMQDVWNYSNELTFGPEFMKKAAALSAKITNEREREYWLQNIRKVVGRSN